MLRITYYLEVTSSWCYWAEPTWAELKRRYKDQAEFVWKIAQMPAAAYPVSRQQCDWFYRRSGSVTGSPFMLNSAWWEPEIKQYLVPNLVAEAARDLGATDDSVRLALAHSGLRQGQKIGRWEVAVEVAAAAGKLDPATLRGRAQSADITSRIQASSAEFQGLQVDQRPTFLIQNGIGDRALFSGIVRLDPLTKAVDALLADAAAYASWKAHFGDPPGT